MVKMDKVQYFFKKDSGSLKSTSRRKIAIFLDFDGTLVPIQKDPEQCFLSKKLKTQLLALSHSQCCYLIILSGRSLSDIKKRIGIRGIYYGGNHGLDISGPNLRFTHPKALTSKLTLKHIALRLRKAITNIEGAWLEDKKFTLSLHYRSVKKENVILIKNVFQTVANEFIEEKRLNVIKGKKVIELTPNVSWNKGSAVLWILEQLKDKCMPFYVGDDETDETAFKVLHRKGITIRIGKSKKTAAQYYLKGHWELPRLLQQIQYLDTIDKIVDYRDE
jgi:trehalose 6-phosphate phosphatase